MWKCYRGQSREQDIETAGRHEKDLMESRFGCSNNGNLAEEWIEDNTKPSRLSVLFLPEIIC